MVSKGGIPLGEESSEAPNVVDISDKVIQLESVVRKVNACFYRRLLHLEESAAAVEGVRELGDRLDDLETQIESIQERLGELDGEHYACVTKVSDGTYQIQLVDGL